jgi:hypothetical protein
VRIRRALHKSNNLANVPQLKAGLQAFEDWGSRVPWLTKQVVVAVIQRSGIHFSDIRATDCGIVIEIALFGTYRRREVLHMAWVGRVVYDLLRLA